MEMCEEPGKEESFLNSRVREGAVAPSEICYTFQLCCACAVGGNGAVHLEIIQLTR